MTKTVYVLTSGGTIEKVYREGTGAVENVGSKIDRYLKLWRLPECEVNVVLMNKDSLEMTDQDRVLILGMVRAILKEKVGIVITHGTDTMVQTGLYLKRSLADLRIPIVLTGAMTPHRHPSPALLNRRLNNGYIGPWSMRIAAAK